MKKYQKDIIGLYFSFFSIFVLISLIDYSILKNYNIMGPVGYWISSKLILFFGISSYVIPFLLGIISYIYFSRKKLDVYLIIRFATYLLTISIWFSIFLGYISNVLDIKIWSHFSGLIGISLSSIFIEYTNYFAPIIILILFVIVNIIFFNYSIVDIYFLLKDRIKNYKNVNIKVNPIEINEENENTISTNNEKIQIDSQEDVNVSSDEEIEKSIEQNIVEREDYIDIKEEIQDEEIDIDSKEDRKKKFFNYNLPSSSLLNSPIETNIQYTEDELHKRSEDLMHALETYNVMGKVRRINQGPVITLFEIEPDEGVRVNKFTTLSDDLARAMEASKVRIIAPIPGTRYVGVEVPNESPAMVYLKSIITSDNYINSTSKMTIALGKTTSGKSFSYELEKMPHLLVAGATGSGKSVCINAIISSILYKAKPDEVKFILIDPKKVELSSYNTLKDYHLITSPSIDEYVVTKTENSTAILDSAIREMERRFELFSELRVRNIAEYNEKYNNQSDLEKVPHIVIIIDELADLMMTSGRAIEDPITRLAQKARAIGIHLVVATQRPSVDVITGLIKSNFPARIAFQVSSKTDSRTIIDQNGAEALLGNGDMLFLPPGSATPIRLHGAYVSLSEIESILSHISTQSIPEEVNLPEINSTTESDNFILGDRDELLIDAAKLVIQYQQASVSLLQRKFRIGYSRAGRIIDELEALGIISGPSGSKAREVLVDESFLDNIIS